MGIKKKTTSSPLIIFTALYETRRGEIAGNFDKWAGKVGWGWKASRL